MAKPVLTLASSAEDKGLLTAEVISKVLMVHPNRVIQMGREGIIPRFEGNRYKLVPSVQGYIRFLKRDNEDEDLISLSKEKARLTKTQRQKAELELAIAKGQYIPVGEVEAEFAGFAKSVVSQLEVLPDRLERDADLQPQQVMLVEAVINQIREDLYQKLTEPEPEKSALEPEPEPDLEALEVE